MAEVGTGTETNWDGRRLACRTLLTDGGHATILALINSYLRNLCHPCFGPFLLPRLDQDFEEVLLRHEHAVEPILKSPRERHSG